ncbi:MAG: hypothetical protein J5940_07000 [Clostridia bacterium]|nr:hypothetical protein [Clostridia bacterium]
MAKTQLTSAALRRTAGEIKRYRIYKKLIPICIGISTMVIVISYVISSLYMKFGAFTVMVNKFDYLDYALTLSESPGFETYTSRLNAEIFQQVTNIDGATLPSYLDNIDGPHNGDNYTAYTFYCKNAGTSTVSYSYEVYIANNKQDIEKAIRIRLYVNGEATDYAYPRTDGVEGPEPGTVAFKSSTSVVTKTIENFAPGDVTKFTLVMWLEGNDPECVDSVLGGEMKIDMSLNIVSDESQSEVMSLPLYYKDDRS